jgi:hypothetical protein
MRKIATVVMALMLMASICYADDTISKTVYSYGVKNTSTTLHQTTIVPTTSIRPLVDKIIGYSIMPLNGNNAESIIGIFDGTDVQLTGEVFAESESEAARAAGKSELWAYGKSIALGIVLRQGANTQAQIYFIRK